MNPIKLRASGNVLEVWERPEFITSGTVGLPVEISFDSHWDALEKVATFRAGERCVTVADPEKGMVVPWEVLEKPQQILQIGVYGSNAEGDLVIPTLWVPVAPIYTGTDPAGDPALDPTIPFWLDVCNRIDEAAKTMQDHAANGENPHGVTAEQVGAAPAGYGLGETSPPSVGWNNTYRSGFIRANTDSPDGGWWYGLNVKYDQNIATQIAFKRVTDKGPLQMAMRHRPDYNNAVPWNSWEYVNPPMLAGVEYRTTERWQGKPVYTKLVDLSDHIDFDDPFPDNDGVVPTVIVAQGVATLVDAMHRQESLGGIFFESNKKYDWEMWIEATGDLCFMLHSYEAYGLDHATLVVKYTKIED